MILIPGTRAAKMAPRYPELNIGQQIMKTSPMLTCTNFLFNFWSKMPRLAVSPQNRSKVRAMQPLKPVAQISETTGFPSVIVVARGFRSRLSNRRDLVAPSLKAEPELILNLLVVFDKSKSVVAESEGEGVLEIGLKSK
jgi:hypothetical protein